MKPIRLPVRTARSTCDLGVLLAARILPPELVLSEVW